jgi:PAS domain S-box-containing protein
MNPEGQILTWNSGAERLKGYRAEEIIGRHFSDFYTPEDQALRVPEKGLDAAARTGRFEIEGWRVRKDGTRFWALVIIDAVRNEAGDLLGFAKVTRDLTERKLAEQSLLDSERALKEANEQLAASQKMEAVGQLSGGIAHDFNNLMMIVLGNLETIKRNKSELANVPNLERNLNNAIRGAQRAAALTTRLLAFSRRQPLDPKPVDVNKFLSGSAEFLQRSLGELIDTKVVGAAGLWDIEVDSNQLETALLNVAINSRDAMPNGGKLTIEAANTYLDAAYCQAIPELSPGQFVVICITDNGEGMDRDITNRAFEPFFTTKEVGHGTGLGLSQVYGFVKQSGGHVKIYSEVAQGTTVKLYFPRFVGEIADDDIEVTEILAQGEQGETVLLVEDDKDVRAYLSDVMRGLQYRVLSAANAAVALTLLAQDQLRIDVLLTDIVMPGMNGRELGEKAIQIRPRLKVLYMSGYPRNAVLHHGRVDHGIELLQKPVPTQVLASRLRDALN